jgi:O-antigen ligase
MAYARTTGLGARGTPIAVLIGVLLAIPLLKFSSLELRWLVYPTAFLTVLALLLAVRDRVAFLSGAFVLSLQGDVHLRFLHGQAGSDGFAFPLTVLVGVLLVTWLTATGELGRGGRLRGPGRLAWPIALLLGTSFLSLCATGERFVGLTQLLYELELLFIYLLALNLIRSEADLERTVKLVLVALAMQSVIYYVQSALGLTFTLTGEIELEDGAVPRPGGTVSTNPSGFGSFLVPLVLLAVAFFVTEQRRRQGRWLAALIALGVGAIGLTFTRAVWAAFALGMVVLVGLAMRRRMMRPGRLLAIGVAAVVVALALAPMIAERLSSSPTGDAYEERRGLMEMALQVIESNPIVGVGPGAYRHTYKRYLSAEHFEQWMNPVHNAYLLRAAETGLAGAAAWIALLVLGLRQAFRLTRASSPLIRCWALGWSAALLALCWEMYWDIWRGWTYNALLWFMLGVTEAADAMAARQGSGSTERSSGGAGRADGGGGGGPPVPPVRTSSAPMSQAAPSGRASLS